MRISIIGAGIGGLTTAIALKQKGFDVALFEASKNFTKAGSGYPEHTGGGNRGRETWPRRKPPGPGTHFDD